MRTMRRREDSGGAGDFIKGTRTVLFSGRPSKSEKATPMAQPLRSCSWAYSEVTYVSSLT